MPPFDLGLPIFPAEKDDTPVPQMRKITETQVDILDKDAHLLNGEQRARGRLKSPGRT